jgi:hypothetical protein
MKVSNSHLCYHCNETHESIIKKKYIKPSQTELLMKYYKNDQNPLEGYKINIDEENYKAKFTICDRMKAKQHFRIARYGTSEDLECFLTHNYQDDNKSYFYCEENDDVITIPKT